MSSLSSILKSPAWWTMGLGSDVVLTSIIRVTRNLKGYPFPGWSTPESRDAVVTALLPVVRLMRGYRNGCEFDMSELSYEQRCALLERKLLTPCMAARGAGCRVVLYPKKKTVFMLNEEEHLVAHCFSSIHKDVLCGGLRLLRELDAASKDIPWAFDPEMGYLTSLPSEAGDGIQFSQVLHLPALHLAGMMEAVSRAMEKLHVSMGPFYADGNEGTGNTYIFSSVPGPLDSQSELAQYFGAVMSQMELRELQVRGKLQENDLPKLCDSIGRAYGLLRHAHRLSLHELRDAVSLLILATQIGHLEWTPLLPRDAVAQLGELVHRFSVETALGGDAQEESLSHKRAMSMRSWLSNRPHHFTNLYD
ncbi:MAG: hypothetical protein ACI4P8_00420 [Akkermansia sp.]